jgi:F-type H+-transporting ATPase subunit b
MRTIGLAVTLMLGLALGAGSAIAGGGDGGGHGDPSKHFRFFGSPFNHYNKDVAGGPYGDGVNQSPQTGAVIEGAEDRMSAPFIFVVINFAVLLLLLSRLGGPAVRKAAADRHDQIKSALEEAARLRKQAADKLAEYEAKLKAADAEIAALVAGMRADAEADQRRILDAAERQAALMKRDAEARIAAEIEAARAVLTREVTAAAAAATEVILREQTTAADQRKLVAAFLRDVAAPGKEAR